MQLHPNQCKICPVNFEPKVRSVNRRSDVTQFEQQNLTQSTFNSSNCNGSANMTYPALDQTTEAMENNEIITSPPSITLADDALVTFDVKSQSFKDYYSQFCAAARNLGNADPCAQSSMSENTPASGEKKSKKNRKG